MPDNQPHTWIVTVSGDRPVSAVADDVKRAGIAVVEVFEHTGNIVVRAGPDAPARIRAIHGVTDISPDHAVDIGPPGAPIS